MLNALYELGKTYIEKEDFQEIDILLDDLKNTKSVILVEFIRNGDEINYIDTKEKEFDSSESFLYLYKKGSSRGTNLTPSSLITDDPTKTFNIKFFKWFENNGNKKESDVFVNKIFNEIENKKDIILENIKEIYSNLESKNNALLTISIEENNKSLFLNDYPIFINHLKKEASEKYYKMSSVKGEMKGNGQCLLCGENKEVMGLVPNAAGFKFSTVDKPGNIPELNQINQWKMVPICFDCALNLEAGNKFVDKYLSFSEFGLRYYVIPTFLLKKDDIIYKLFDNYLEDKVDKRSYYNTIASEEDDLIEEDIKDLDNFLEFKFFFYEKSNSAFNIMGFVESIVPSWINNLRLTQQELIKNPLFEEDSIKEIFMKKDFSGNFLDLNNSNKKFNLVTSSNWIFGFLRDFFGTKDFNKYYIDLISSIFSNKRVNFDFILSYALKKIRNNFRNGNEYFVKNFAIETLLILRFLRKLNLKINGEIMDTNEKINENEINYQLTDYIDELNTPAKKASFLLGVLTRKLIAIQYKELGSTPFTNKLWGMSLDEKKIQKLYPMVINKLNEYKIAYTDLSEEISQNLVESTNSWNLSRDETSFYFVLGYTLFRLYKKPDKKKY